MTSWPCVVWPFYIAVCGIVTHSTKTYPADNMLIFKVIFVLSFVFAASAVPDFGKTAKLEQNNDVAVLFYRAVTVL
jgi:hypothetical protein